jgi:MoaA/NifB/PqqE/SkfB family radical SAM enzyme
LDFDKYKITKKAKIDIGLRCNANCYFCYYRSSLDSPVKPLDKIKKEIGLLIDAGFTKIELSGGEPTIHPDFIDILSYITEKGAEPSFLTNAINIDQDIINRLAHQSLTVDSVIENGRKIVLRGVAGLSMGGEIKNANEEMDAYYKNIAIEATKALDLIFSGVDMIISNNGAYYINEVNSYPSLQQHSNAHEIAIKVIKYLIKNIN